MRPLDWILPIALLAAPAAASAPAVAEQRVGPEQTLHRHGALGERVRIFTYTRFDAGCRPLPPPPIRITAPPAHGAVTTEPAQAEVRVLTDGAPDCTLRLLPGSPCSTPPLPASAAPTVSSTTC